jgi:hypothetical protein
MSSLPTEPSWSTAAKIWWRIFRRSILSSFILWFLIGFLIGIAVTLLDIEQDITLLSSIVWGICWMLINIFFVKKVINKKFDWYVLQLVKIDQSNVEIQ